jgi:hypothetical protein
MRIKKVHSIDVITRKGEYVISYYLLPLDLMSCQQILKCTCKRYSQT